MSPFTSMVRASDPVIGRLWVRFHSGAVKFFRIKIWLDNLSRTHVKFSIACKSRCIIVCQSCFMKTFFTIVHSLIFSEKLEKNSELNTVRSILVAENFSKLLPVIFFRLFVISSVLFIDLIYLSQEVTFPASHVCLSACVCVCLSVCLSPGYLKR